MKPAPRAWSRRRGALGCTALALSFDLGSSARAADALNSSDAPTNVTHKGEEAAHNELNVVPVAGGSTDVGIGGGYFAGLARVEEGASPYVWNVESSAFLTFKPRDGGGVELPYQDIYVKLTVPKFFSRSLRLELRPSYTAETTIHYFGLGNASSAEAPAGAPSTYFQYARVHPAMDVDLRWSLADHLIGRIGMRYVQNWIDTKSSSKLRDDLRTGDAETKKLLGATAAHAVALFSYGVQWDSRDNEASPHAGSFHAATVRISPGGAGMFPYRYGEATFVARVYVPIWKPRITLAGRIVGDLLFGDPPFYELARFDDTFAIGGAIGVRGVPAGRYYGKVKAFGNLEVRTELFSFHALGKPLIFGVTAFVDGGRVWADTRSQPALDGRTLGLKYGVGGGLRIQSGTSFVLRGDLAWSPDATPVGAYVAAGQMF